MSFLSCSRSNELAAELKAGRLSDAWDPTLRAHVANCRKCSDLVVVSEALKGARAESLQTAEIASPSLLWWRAQLRRRNEALERISKPTSWVGKFALLSTLIVGLVLVVNEVQQAGEWLRRLTGIPDPTAAQTQSQGSVWGVALVILTFGALALLGGFVVYLASEKG